MRYIIYTLSDPITMDVRYVGATSSTLKNRLEGHLLQKAGTLKCNWISSLKDNGLIPVIEEIETVKYELKSLENYWISQFDSWGFDLFNKFCGPIRNIYDNDCYLYYPMVPKPSVHKLISYCFKMNNIEWVNSSCIQLDIKKKDFLKFKLKKNNKKISREILNWFAFEYEKLRNIKLRKRLDIPYI